MYAAHVALMCLVKGKVAQQQEHVQLAILSRHYEISWVLQLNGPVISSTIYRHPHATPCITSNFEPERPLSKPSVEPRPITTEDLRLFQIPDNLHGKQFIPSPGSDKSCVYEIIGYTKKRDNVVIYDALYDDFPDSIPADANEMMRMLDDSLYFPAWSWWRTASGFRSTT